VGCGESKEVSFHLNCVSATDRKHDLKRTASVLLPGALAGKPNTAYTRSLIEDAKTKIPRLRWDLTEVGLRNFLLDEESIGIVCTKYRSSNNNGWTFPPLSEARAAWSQRYGSVKWDNPDAEDWSKK
jgi:hypothetical protein